MIPIVLEKLPNVIRLRISRKLGKENWSIDDFLICINTEITARESYEFMKHDKHEGTSNKSSFSGSALLANSNPKKCVFCQSVNHYSDKCNIVTEVDIRRELLKRNWLCFNCLRGGHTKKNCRKQIIYFKCKTEGQHTALWNPLQKQTQSYVTDDNGKEDSSTNLVKSNTSILLQTANAIVTDEKENQCCAVKIFSDPGSQQTFFHYSKSS